jgi:hypothetical protein
MISMSAKKFWGIPVFFQASNLRHIQSPASLRALSPIKLPYRFNEEEKPMMLMLDQISLDSLFHAMIPPVVGKRHR